MRLFIVLALAAFGLRSDIGRVYASGKEPGLVLGTTAANTAQAGTPEVPGSEKSSLRNQHLAHNYGDTAK